MNKGILALIVLLLTVSSPRGLRASDDCSRTAGAAIYSNAFAHEETGDLLGYELAIKRHPDSTVEGFLFVYEGGPSEPIVLPGRLSGRNLHIQGDWVQRLIEYPTKKETVKTLSVAIEGVLNPTLFRGEIMIGGEAEKESVRLKRVTHTWLCKR